MIRSHALVAEPFHVKPLYVFAETFRVDPLQTLRVSVSYAKNLKTIPVTNPLQTRYKPVTNRYKP